MLKAIAMALVLSGCAGAGPQALWVNDPGLYSADYLKCANAAAHYSMGLSGQDILSSGLEGGLSQAPGIFASPLVPAVGAAGAASSATIQGLDLLPKTKARVFLHCMEQLTLRDGSATMADPF